MKKIGVLDCHQADHEQPRFWHNKARALMLVRQQTAIFIRDNVIRLLAHDEYRRAYQPLKEIGKLEPIEVSGCHYSPPPAWKPTQSRWCPVDRREWVEL